MIKSIKLNDIPPYVCGEQFIEAQYVNFLFGLNGSGKTTISRYLRFPFAPSYYKCSIEWNGSPVEISVYNRDYVDENFKESSIPGIFTLGEENIDAQRKIDEYRCSIKELNKHILKLQDTLKDSEGNGLYSQLHNLDLIYAGKFWTVKQQLDKEHSPLQFAIEGFRGSKDTFKQKVMSEYSSNKSELVDRSELEQLCTQLYGSSVEKRPILVIPDFSTLLTFEDKEVLKKVVVGKDDVDISGLIKKLGSDGWFKQGVSYIASSEGVCPFCQRPLETSFLSQVEEYFDESYTAAINEIERINNEYSQISEKALIGIQTIIDDSSEFVRIEELKHAYQQFKLTIDANQRRLLDKKISPNSVVQLDSISEVTSSIIRLLENANEAISQYNARIDHIKEEKAMLISKVWKYILNALSFDIETFRKEMERIKTSIAATEAEIHALEKEITCKSQQKLLFEQKLTSILPTARGINTLLQNYGVTGFSLKVDEYSKTYQFVRADGSPAFNSLSEGERNFVTFLYFMYSLRGNTEESGHNNDKIVVIDDPVSSLDSDVLFIVSSIIRDLFKKVYADEGTIKQLFILSHNSFFYKEVSYKLGVNKRKTGYWMITKENNASKITRYSDNPVNSTYEMLWNEVRKAEENPAESNTISLANTMRRILEHYFSLLGGKDLSQYHLEFPDGERQVFKSLISWANAGSHSVFDDYSATPNLYNSEKYLKVFRDLFNEAGHLAHYNMMMKNSMEEDESGQDEI